MERREQRFQHRLSKRREQATGGLVLVVIGCFLFARQAGVELPSWLFTWPMIPIIVGIFVGIKTRFKDFGWLILIGVGSFFLFDKMQQIPVREYLLPIIVLTVGLIIVLSAIFRKARVNTTEPDSNISPEEAALRSNPDATTDDIMEVVSVFGSAKRVVLAKNFKGGEVVTVFGSSEINLTNADFTGKLVLEVVQVFGGTKLIIPPHWEVQAKTAAIFGGIEDKRTPQSSGNPEKILILDGVTFFGGVTIASY